MPRVARTVPRESTSVTAPRTKTTTTARTIVLTAPLESMRTATDPVVILATQVSDRDYFVGGNVSTSLLTLRTSSLIRLFRLFRHAGMWSGAAWGSCSNCEAGKSENGARTGCDICGQGKYSGVGAASCSNCAAGKYLSDNASNRLLHDSSSDCSYCDVGKFDYGTNFFVSIC